MKNIIVSIIGICLFSTSVWADQKDEFNKREQTALQIINESNKVAQAYGHYKIAVEQFLYSNNGVISQSEDFYAKSHNWIVNLRSGLALIDLSASTPYQIIITKSEEFLSNANQELFELDRTGNLLIRKSKRGVKIIEKSLKIPAPNQSDMKNISAQLLRFQKSAGSALENSSSGVTRQIAAMHQAYQLTSRAMKAKLKEAMIRSGVASLDEVLKRYDDLLIYQQQVIPKILDLESQEMRLESHMLSFAYAQGFEIMQKAEQSCSNFEGQISAFALSEKRQTQAINRKNIICDAIAAHWRGLNITGLTRAELVQEYAATLAPEMKRECANSLPQINCEKFAVLKSIPKSKLAEMSSDELKFYENSWAQLREGI